MTKIPEDCEKCYGNLGWFRGPMPWEKPNPGGYVWQLCDKCHPGIKDYTHESVLLGRKRV